MKKLYCKPTDEQHDDRSARLCHRTFHCFDNHVGYKGQRFQVVGDKPDGRRFPLGWTNTDSLKPWKFLAEHFGLKNLRTELAGTEEPR